MYSIPPTSYTRRAVTRSWVDVDVWPGDCSAGVVLGWDASQLAGVVAHGIPSEMPRVFEGLCVFWRIPAFLFSVVLSP
jgi:hypothetical protein